MARAQYVSLGLLGVTGTIALVMLFVSAWAYRLPLGDPATLRAAQLLLVFAVVQVLVVLAALALGVARWCRPRVQYVGGEETPPASGKDGGLSDTDDFELGPKHEPLSQ